ncbi:hypothetical protein EPUS_08380 [Endocarpon pusillum Z07020]|uniref:Uncharacterized protein n=1 Tax=Endocarpon pusillum (strain Z07020 / HMAS-L-300199) TaxID=1263415 RepID=U1HFY3_ENDPU|nr:uncharacterized protein EPUS_08380 [Endocarpon pusillum Z07020]ERF69030.1 hypothetical protein EPUS_08380 [Endocarpon pusillum Z07020]
MTSFLPWSWTITSTDPSLQPCPSASSILATFAAVNAVASALAIIFGHQSVISRISCKMCGGDSGSKAWRYMWIVPLGLQLAANAVIALLIKRTAGFRADFAIWELVLFFAARPRLSWITLGLFAVKSRKKSGTRDFPWWPSFMSQFVAELILQLIALYIMGRTAHFAASRGFYLVHTDLYRSLPSGARMMYSGALYYLIVGTFAWFSAFGLISKARSPTRFAKEASEEGDSTDTNASSPMLNWKAGSKVATGSVITALIFSLTSVWLASWIFWAGFVRLADDS